jgi:tyrosyl-tRNA synthetase
MLSGVPLIRKKEGCEVHALSMPLVINAMTGKKFGKSEAGAVWLDPAKTSPTQFYQFWINVEDVCVEDYLKIYTMLSQENIEDVMREHRKNPGARHAHIRLAQETTRLVHGESELLVVETATDVLTGKMGLLDVNQTVVDALRNEIPVLTAAAGSEIATVLTETGLASSKTEARRFIKENAITINGQKIQKEFLDASDFQNGRLLIRRGKAYKDSALIES